MLQLRNSSSASGSFQSRPSYPVSAQTQASQSTVASRRRRFSSHCRLESMSRLPRLLEVRLALNFQLSKQALTSYSKHGRGYHLGPNGNQHHRPAQYPTWYVPYAIILKHYPKTDATQLTATSAPNPYPTQPYRSSYLSTPMTLARAAPTTQAQFLSQAERLTRKRAQSLATSCKLAQHASSPNG
jgi:hypothetical protein